MSLCKEEMLILRRLRSQSTTIISLTGPSGILLADQYDSETILKLLDIVFWLMINIPYAIDLIIPDIYTIGYLLFQLLLLSNMFFLPLKKLN